jgi:hypothetical protein
VSPTSTSDGTRFGLARAFVADLTVAAGTLLVATLLLLAALGAVNAMIAIAASGGDPDTLDIPLLVQQMTPQILAASVVAMLIAAAITWWLRAARLPALPAMPASGAYLLAVAGGVTIQFACVAIAMASADAGTPITPTNADPLQDLERQARWLAWPIIVLVAPLAEEILFRHVLLRRFAVAGRASAGVAVTSLLFAAMHEPVPGAAGVVPWLAALLLYAAMGAGFAVIYLRTGRLGAAVVAHAACNAAALALAAFSPL